MEFAGLRLMARALNLNNAHLIRNRLDKNKPLEVTIDNKKYKMLLRSNKTNE
jgi:hypothetical protein